MSADDALQVGAGHFMAGRAPSPGANGAWETISAGFPVVELQDTAQALTALDLASLLAYCLMRFDQPISESLVVALAMIVFQELYDGLA